MARASRTFERSPREVGEARRYTSTVLAQWGIDAGDATLVVGELAANAVLHARSDFTVSLCHEDCRLVVEVADHDLRVPSVAVVPAPTATSGRGLSIVQCLSAAWGARRSQDGKVLWADLDLDLDLDLDVAAAAPGV